MYKILIIAFLLIKILGADDSLKKVSLQLSWLNQFQFAGYYIAKEKGFYNELGLDVDIKPFKFGINVPNLVNKEEVDFAIGRETLVIEKVENTNIVALYALFQSSPLVLLSTKESQINTINDFLDKKIMTTIDDASEVSIKAMILSHKINPNSLKLISHTHNINDLINKNTDIISAYISKAPYELEKRDIKYNIFSPKDYGFDMYSDFLYTNKKLISKDKELVKNFKEASLKGWEYAFNNIEESVEIILQKYNSQNLTKEELIYEAKKLKELSYQNSSLGNIDKNKVQRIHDLYNVMGLLSNKINIDDFIYDENHFLGIFTDEEIKYIKQNPILKIGIRNDFKPFTFTNNLGKREGIIHDYLNYISKKTGFVLTYEINTDEVLLEKLKNNQIDFIPMILNAEKNIENIDISKPYFQINEIFLDSNHSHHIKNDNLLVENFSESIEHKISYFFLAYEMFISSLSNKKLINSDNSQFSNQSNIEDIKMAFNKNSDVLETIILKTFETMEKSEKDFIEKKWTIFIKDNFLVFVFNLLFFVLMIILFAIIYRQISLHNINSRLVNSKKELEKANLELKELAEKDFLTKLYNRRFFMNMGNNTILLNKREGKKSSILIFDIDDFKRINDTYGHPVGDLVLSSLANIVVNNSRKSDIISRIGGEEFMILFPNTDLESAKEHSEFLRKKIETTTVSKDGLNLYITVSMGLTTIDYKDTLETAITRADNNLYQAKRSGKNILIYN